MDAEQTARASRLAARLLATANAFIKEGGGRVTYAEVVNAFVAVGQDFMTTFTAQKEIAEAKAKSKQS